MTDYRADPWSWDTVSEWDYPPQEAPSTIDLPIPGDLYTRRPDPLSPGGLGPASGLSTRAKLRGEASGLFTGPNSFARTAWETAKSLPGTIARAVDFPAAALRGEVDPRSDEGLGRAADLAGTVTLGGGAVPRAVPKGPVMRSGMGRGPIQTAAIRVGDQVYAGPTHGDIMSRMPAEAQKAFWDQYSPKNEGFVTSKGDFVDREQAFQMAYRSGQIEDTLTGQPSLSSEDLEFGRRPSLDWDDDTLNANRSVAAGAVPIFSRMEREAAALPQPKAQGSQWNSTLKNRGVPQEEMDWTGVADWLKERGTLPVTKDELLAEIGRRQTQVGVMRLGKNTPSDIMKFEDQIRREHPDWTDNQIGEAGLAAMSRTSSHTRHSTYQLSGGENYREVLLTLPVSPKTPGDITDARRFLQGERGTYVNHLSDDEVWSEARKLGFEPGGERGRENMFRSSHWDEPNVLAHMRVNDRFLPDAPEPAGFTVRNRASGNQGPRFKTEDEAQEYMDNFPARVSGGKAPLEIVPIPSRQPTTGTRTLFAEEIQSDWGQSLRRTRKQIEDQIDNDFDTIADRLVKAGVIEKVCD